MASGSEDEVLLSDPVGLVESLDADRIRKALAECQDRAYGLRQLLKVAQARGPKPQRREGEQHDGDG